MVTLMAHVLGILLPLKANELLEVLTLEDVKLIGVYTHLHEGDILVDEILFACASMPIHVLAQRALIELLLMLPTRVRRCSG